MKSSRILLLFATLLFALAGIGLRAEAATDPTVHEIYQTANGGDLRGARQMIDQVLAHHPDSAKAHYVKAELAARDRDAATARSELQTAEKLAPGLPFAKADAVSALRSQVNRLSAPATSSNGTTPSSERRSDTRRMGAPPQSGFPIGSLLVVAAVVVGIFLLLRRRRPEPYAQANPYARDDAFGRVEPGMYPPQGYPQGGYPQGYPPPGYPPQQGGGLGSTLGRGLATGLAVGAGAVAAEEIGHRIFNHGHDGQSLQDASQLHHGDAGQSSLARDAGLGSLDPGYDPNRDMGGQDFGIADNGGWDDGGGLGDVGGDDWDR